MGTDEAVGRLERALVVCKEAKVEMIEADLVVVDAKAGVSGTVWVGRLVAAGTGEELTRVEAVKKIDRVLDGLVSFEVETVMPA